jgi:CBS domain-containing protein
MQIQEMMRADVKIVTRDTPIKDVAATMRDSDIGSVLVVDRNRSLAGIVSLGDLSRKAEPGRTQTALGGTTAHR